MTPDLDAIRAALAAIAPVDPSATFEDREDWQVALRNVQANAPTWLRELCDEIERLRLLTPNTPLSCAATGRKHSGCGHCPGLDSASAAAEPMMQAETTIAQLEALEEALAEYEQLKGQT